MSNLTGGVTTAENNNKKHSSLLCGLENLFENSIENFSNRKSIRRSRSLSRQNSLTTNKQNQGQSTTPFQYSKTTSRVPIKKQQLAGEEFSDLVEKAKQAVVKKDSNRSVLAPAGGTKKSLKYSSYRSESFNNNNNGTTNFQSESKNSKKIVSLNQRQGVKDLNKNKQTETIKIPPKLSNSSTIESNYSLKSKNLRYYSLPEKDSWELSQKFKDLFQKRSSRKNSSLRNLNSLDLIFDNSKLENIKRTNSLPRNMDKNSKTAGNLLKKNKSTNTKNDEQIITAMPTIKPTEMKSVKIDESNLITLDNEDYARYVESYERNLENKKDSSGNNSSDQQKTQNIPVSILKQPKSSINNKKKQSSVIMNLQDRDIVVIDSEDEISESEVKVILNPRKEVDLADLLGNNWPSTAGDAALVLNNDKGQIVNSSSNSSVSSYKADRNKSANPLSHIQSSKNLQRNANIKKLQHQQQIEKENFADNNIKIREKKLKNVEPVYDNSIITTNSQQQHQLQQSVSSDENEIQPSPLNEIPGTNGLGVGSMVEVSTDVCEDLYGVVRWIGSPPGSTSKTSIMVGIELEDDPGQNRPLNLTDGVHNGFRLFKCPQGRALFVNPSQSEIRSDRRFLEIDIPSNNNNNNINNNISKAAVASPLSGSGSSSSKRSLDTKMFGQVECHPVVGAIAPLKIFDIAEVEEICGKFKGIQGHHNSCYLDATLFAMFMFTSVFDSLLFRPPEPEDISHYEEVQKVLREEIVNPLRKNNFVRADRVMKLRELLDKLSSVSGLTSEEKDPEEFLNSLLVQIMRVDPFLKLSSGQDTFLYQLFVEKDDRLSFPSVQQLFEQSFLASDIKLKEVPSCLIIQMPRFGKNFKMYPRILPSQVLDVTDIIADSPRQCSVCGKLAEYECKECFGILQCGVGLESTAFCLKCLETVHQHAKRTNHKPKEISVPQDFKIMAEHLTVPRLFMELFAVVCIETSHYVCFTRTGSGSDSPWVFFDSMADRAGEQNGYNIPELITVPDLPQWLSEDGARIINDAPDKLLPEHAKRLFCDAYMCLYQSTDVMMYR